MIKVEFEALEVKVTLEAGKFTGKDLLDIEKPIALTIINKQVELVPVASGATKLSIRQHIDVATEELVIDEIGPETDYSVYIEFGVASKPNYPIQPFVRPSGEGNRLNITRAAEAAYLAKIKEKYG